MYTRANIPLHACLDEKLDFRKRLAATNKQGTQLLLVRILPENASQ